MHTDETRLIEWQKLVYIFALHGGGGKAHDVGLSPLSKDDREEWVIKAFMLCHY